ncbi:unnamed protein product [Schistosoma turkestanicum]|nr:unnamed protein product [Schistosoma turkestanicum]
MNKYEVSLSKWMLLIYLLDTTHYSLSESTTIQISNQKLNRIYELIGMDNGIRTSENNDNMSQKISDNQQMLFDKNIFSIKPTNITVREHVKHVRFDCQINEKINILSHKWLKNKVDIHFHSDVQHRYQILQNRSLYLTQINRNDAGIYTCQIVLEHSNNYYYHVKPHSVGQYGSNQRPIEYSSEYLHSHASGYNEELEKVKRNFEASAWLNVQYIPNVQINHSINPIYLGRNGPGRIPCIVDATPSIDLIEWRKLMNSSTKAHSNVIMNSFQKHSKSKGTILPVEQLLRDENISSYFTIYWYEWDVVKENDAGFYQCRARNTIGWSSWSPNLQVIVNELPRFIRTPNLIEFVRNNMPLILPCEAYGQPKPTVQWFYSKLNQQNSNLSKSVMVISLNNNTYKIAIKNSVISREHDLTGNKEDITQQSNNAINHSDQYSFENDKTTNELPILSVILPSGVNKIPDGSLLIYTWNASKVTGQYFCIAKNSIGYIITSVEIKQDQSIQIFDKRPNNIILHVKPLIHSAILSWNTVKLPAILHSETTVDSIKKQCYYVTYHSLVRSGDEWIATVIQPEYASKIRLHGLIPNELYAFRISHWCTQSNHNHSSSSTVLTRTQLPLDNSAESTLMNNNTQYWELEQGIDSPKPPSPQSLKLQIIQTEQYSSILTWEVQGNPQISLIQSNVQQKHNEKSEESISYFQVEFIVCTLLKTNLLGISNCTDSNNYVYQWKSLAPVRYPKLTFEFNNNQIFLLEEYNRNDYLTVDNDAIRTAVEYNELNAFLTKLHDNSLVYELRFRVKSFGLTSVSEPSNEIIIKHPLLPSILNALNQTLHYERYLIYKAIRQAYFESLENYAQNSIHVKLHDINMTTLKNSSIFSPNYLTNEQFRTHWYVFCLIFISLLIILILTFILLRKSFKKIKIQLQSKRKKNTKKSVNQYHQQHIVATSSSNVHILNNQYQANQTSLCNSFDLYNSNYVLNEFTQKSIPIDDGKLDACMNHDCCDCKFEHLNHYLNSQHPEQHSMNTTVFNSNHSLECQVQTGHVNCDQVYLILSSCKNSAYYSPDTKKNPQIIGIENTNLENVWNTEDVAEETDNHLTNKHYAVMTPEFLRSEYVDPLHQTIIKHTLNEPESIVPCKCLQASSLTLYSPRSNRLPSKTFHTSSKCYCTE